MNPFVPGIVDARRQSGTPAGATGWVWDSRFLPTGIELSEDDTRITNVSGGTDNLHTVPTALVFDEGVGTIPNQFFYYEIHFTQAYSGPDNFYNGYIGWGDKDDFANYNLAHWQSTLPHRITQGSWGLGWRGNGELRQFTLIDTFTELQYGDRNVPPIVARIIHNPSLHRVWLAGRTGQFINGSDGTSYIGSPINSGGTYDPPTAQQVPIDGWIGANVRNPGDTMKLVVREADFASSLPSNCVALENFAGYAPPATPF